MLPQRLGRLVGDVERLAAGARRALASAGVGVYTLAEDAPRGALLVTSDLDGTAEVLRDSAGEPFTEAFVAAVVGGAVRELAPGAPLPAALRQIYREAMAEAGALPPDSCPGDSPQPDTPAWDTGSPDTGSRDGVL